jgi:hypothetical protein
MSVLAPELALLPDVEAIVSAYLRSRPRVVAIVGDRVYGAFPSKAGPEPIVLVQRVGGIPPLSQPLVVDEADLQLDAWGGPKALARELADTCRAELASLEGTEQPGGIIGAVRFGALRWLPDETFSPPRPRYVFDVTLTTRASYPLSAIRSASPPSGARPSSASPPSSPSPSP